MSNEKTIMGANKIVSLEEVIKDKGAKEPVFSKGLYHWVMFILSLYTRVKEKLNIDFESFVILQVVVSHSLYETNKLGIKSFSDLEEQMEKITEKNYLNKRKLTFASIAEVLQLPRETVRRKIISLSKRNILPATPTAPCSPSWPSPCSSTTTYHHHHNIILYESREFWVMSGEWGNNL